MSTVENNEICTKDDEELKSTQNQETDSGAQEQPEVGPSTSAMIDEDLQEDAIPIVSDDRAAEDNSIPGQTSAPSSMPIVDESLTNDVVAVDRENHENSLVQASDDVPGEVSAENVNAEAAVLPDSLIEFDETAVQSPVEAATATASGKESKEVTKTEEKHVEDLLAESDECSAAATGGKISSPSEAAAASQKSFYKIKHMQWKDTDVPIVTQNENGPCPLIAIINALLLRNKVNPFGSKIEISADELMAYLGDCILFNAPKNISEGAQLNYEQNMQDAFSVFHKLQTGLDVNVKFTGVQHFEYTPECIIFDLLNVPVLHGWLIDPQAVDVIAAVGKLSYNQLVEKIITSKTSDNNDLITEALVAENFLERSASQLTYYGLCELNEVLKSDELAVLFRNNHFSTMYKHKNELFQLVTDQGFLHESNVIWETLSNIEGDGLFVDSNFVTVPPKPAPPTAAILPNANLSEAEQIQQDYLVALSLQEDQKKEDEKAVVWQEYKEKKLRAPPDISDEELAWRLQAEEQKQATEATQDGNRAGGAGAAGSSNSTSGQQASEGKQQTPAKKYKKSSDCTVL